MKVLLVVILVLLVLVLGISYGLFRFGFYIPKNGHINPHDFNMGGSQYDGLEEIIDAKIVEMEAEPWENVEITSYDGLKLKGYLLINDVNKPFMLFMHGYHGCWQWDGYGTYRIAKDKGYNLLMVDERAHGKSDGTVTCFAKKEQYDCLKWVDFLRDRFGYDQKLIISGVSMGCSIVLMAAAKASKGKVDGIIADCGFASAPAMIKKACRDMKLPEKIFVPLAYLGGKIYGNLTVTGETVEDCVKQIDVPVIFIHGTSDSIVPFENLDILYNACGSKDKIRLVVEGSDHAVCAVYNYEAYKAGIEELLAKVL